MDGLWLKFNSIEQLYYIFLFLQPSQLYLINNDSSETHGHRLRFKSLNVAINEVPVKLSNAWNQPHQPLHLQNPGRWRRSGLLDRNDLTRYDEETNVNVTKIDAFFALPLREDTLCWKLVHWNFNKNFNF